VVFNGGAEIVFGYRPEEVLGKPLDILLPGERIDAHRRHAEAFARGPDQSRAMAARERLFGRRKDGTLFNIEVGISRRSERGNVLCTAVVRDVTQRVQQEEKIARLSRIKAVLSGINSAIVRIRNREDLFREACRIAVEEGGFRMAWIGLAEPDLGKARPVSWMGADDGYLEEVGHTLDGETLDRGAAGRALREKRPIVFNDVEKDAEVVFRREALARGYRALAVLPLLVRDTAVGVIALYAAEPGSFDHEEMRLLGELAGDIAFALEVMEKEKQLVYLAHHDVVTGQPNRALFSERLEQRVRAAHHDRKLFAVVMLDLERFRNINETLGRHVGDAVLRHLAQRLNDAIGETEVLANVGADHFAIATRRIDDAAEIARIVEQILAAAFGQPFDAGERLLHLAARAGIAVYPADGADGEGLYRNAEAALREAKRTGQKYQFYAPQMNATVAQTLHLENRMRGAVQRNEFVLHYQPKVDLGTGSIVGLEALIRWLDPETGLVPPAQFIPLLEETGLIVQAGCWAMAEAARTAAAFRARGLPPVRIAVNVSPIQLRQKDFVRSVEEAIAAAGGGAHGLDLEITESVIMHDIEANVRKLDELRRMGVELAIDDFGTGYSSLAYIGRLPVGVIKIDRAFIRNLDTHAENVPIVQTIISLTHELGCKVVAEGVETEEQAGLLRRLGCDYYQGYLFSKPLPADGIERFLASQASKGD
jgi:diguanylate cyclase (GGDEF)-like protein/PAS domain S-box-containing protein